MANGYQGTPVQMTITIKNGNTWVSDFTGKSFRAVAVDSMGQTVKRWSTADGTIAIGAMTEGEVTKGTATFGFTVSETKNMIGKYTIECEDVTQNLPSIGKVKDIVTILQSNLGSGR